MIKFLKILKEDSHRQAVEEVHQNDHDQEHKGEEEDIAEGRVEGDVGELELSNEHGEGLDQAETKVVEEGIVSISAAIVFMEEDVETKSKGEEEEGIPDDGLNLTRCNGACGTTRLQAKTREARPLPNCRRRPRTK